MNTKYKNENTYPPKASYFREEILKTEARFYETFQKFRYLQSRISTGNLKQASQISVDERFPTLEQAHIERLAEVASQKAYMEQKKIRIWKGRNALTRTRAEKIFARKLEGVLNLSIGINEIKNGVLLLPRSPSSGLSSSKLTIGNTFPDVVVIGLRPGKNVLSRGMPQKFRPDLDERFQGPRLRQDWIGTIFEINGPVHNEKYLTDLIHKSIWEEFGLYTVDYDNDDVAAPGFQEHLRKLVEDFKSNYNQPLRRERIRRFFFLLNLFNIATYIPLWEADADLLKTFGIKAGLEEAFEKYLESIPTPFNLQRRTNE